MTRSTLLTVAVVLSLSLAGCSALPMWDDGGSSVPGTETDGVPTPDPGGEGGTGPEADYPDGYGAGGVDDPEAAMSAHLSALGDSEGFVFTYDALIREGDSETSIGVVNQADNADRVGYEIQNRPDRTLVTYFEDDRAYTRQERGGDVTYNVTDYEYDMARFTGYQFVAPLLASVEYRDAEVVETDEGTFYHYVAEEVTDPASVLRNRVDEERIDRFDVALVVDEQGVVRHANFVVEADRTITVSMDVGEIDSTDAERPDWFDEAEDS